MTRYIGVVGSRDFNNSELVDNFISTLPYDSVIVSGGARGVDTWAIDAAMRYRLRYREYYPKKFDDKGNYKGHHVLFDRNTSIIDQSHMVVAFWNGSSKGTADSINKAKSQGKEVIIVAENGNKTRIPPQGNFGIQSYSDAPNLFKEFSFSSLSSYIQDTNDDIPFLGKYYQLSVHSPATIYVDGMRFPSIIHAFVGAHLAKTDERIDMIAEMDLIDWPVQWVQNKYIKELMSNPSVWESVMRNLMYQKFSQTPYKELLETVDGQIPSDHLGENEYGKLLQDVRDRMSSGKGYYFPDPIRENVCFIESPLMDYDEKSIQVICVDTAGNPVDVVSNYWIKKLGVNLPNNSIELTRPLIIEDMSSKFILLLPIKEVSHQDILFDDIKTTLYRMQEMAREGQLVASYGTPIIAPLIGQNSFPKEAVDSIADLWRYIPYPVYLCVA